MTVTPLSATAKANPCSAAPTLPRASTNGSMSTNPTNKVGIQAAARRRDEQADGDEQRAEIERRHPPRLPIRRTFPVRPQPIAQQRRCVFMPRLGRLTRSSVLVGPIMELARRCAPAGRLSGCPSGDRRSHKHSACRRRLPEHGSVVIAGYRWDPAGESIRLE